MDVDDSAPSASTTVSREKTAPFLIRTFVKIGSFHRLTLFEDGTLPTTDEQQIFTWKDATLREVVTTLRNTAPLIAEYRHPLSRFSFRTVYADSSNKGRYSQKDLGMVYSRDILGEPGTLTATAPRLTQDTEPARAELDGREREQRTLDELRFLPGDFLLVAVLLPKNVTLPSELSIKGSGAAVGSSGGPPSNGWRSGAGGIGGASASAGRGSGAGLGRGGGGGGHWRGDSNAPPPGSGPRGGRGGGRGDRDRDRDLDRPDPRIPPPRRNTLRRDNSPPPRGGGGWGDRDRGGRGGNRRASRSRSRSPPPPRRKGRYD
ncbi:Sin3 associated polypeptide p18-domain-containing protein [Gymnopilus junonius]|uniref:Sin3 associated polypeptide p18-domain-containing protein n=1 Tax=Gymnopilus junonius TaxID=109634 RepID=A0A9P5TKV7_GYMJU|nr:Sin3 associated polypeptide p18-domain-containing protein [Gymnopilus junonius]